MARIYCFAPASVPLAPLLVLGLRWIMPRVRGVIDSLEGINCCNSGGTLAGNFGTWAFGTPPEFEIDAAGAGIDLAAAPGDTCDSRA